ncbi:MAG TPA: class I SAM-dependent methyltransferase [Streptosporangiaceae bacterium]|nr:class I SAM-dependent methyltransferase [Streptosporangiaceae bacterium]
MDELTRTRRSYDLVADRYSAHVSGELAGKPLDRALLAALAELTAGGPVVDVGCGPGHVAAHLAGHGIQIVGLDLSSAMCATALRDTGLPAVVGDMTALPVPSNAVAGVVCFYALIHLDTAHRMAAYQECARVLRSGGYALVAFHTSDGDVPVGGVKALTDWWGHEIDLTFRFLDPVAEVRAIRAAGLDVIARLDRRPHTGIEHPSERSYLLLRRP